MKFVQPWYLVLYSDSLHVGVMLVEMGRFVVQALSHQLGHAWLCMVWQAAAYGNRSRTPALVQKVHRFRQATHHLRKIYGSGHFSGFCILGAIRVLWVL